MTGRLWAYTGTALGGTVSVAANVAHSYLPPTGAPATWSPELGAVVSAVFWPVALYVIVEILVQNRWPTGRGWVIGRYVLLAPVALVAFVVSYHHLSGLLRHYGEDPLTVTIGPVAVDGLMVMAAAALYITTTTEPAPAEPAETPVVDPVAVPEPAHPLIAVEPTPVPTVPLGVSARVNGAIPSGVVR